MCLEISGVLTTEPDIRGLDTIVISVDQLSIIIEGLPTSHTLVDNIVIYNIRNQLATISTSAQLLRLRHKDKLSADTTSFLEIILTECEYILALLENTKDLSVSG
jgi:light-regulated signal transduction histidine kinase (bacteriophytochrome)